MNLNRKLTYLAVLGLFLSGCAGSIGGTGNVTDGSSVIGQLNGDTAKGITEVILISPKGWTCRGFYNHADFQNNHEISNVPLKCDDGRTGSGVIVFEKFIAKFSMAFHLSDKEEGKVIFSLM